MSENTILDVVETEVSRLHLITNNPTKWKIIREMKELVRKYREVED